MTKQRFADRRSVTATVAFSRRWFAAEYEGNWRASVRPDRRFAAEVASYVLHHTNDQGRASFSYGATRMHADDLHVKRFWLTLEMILIHAGSVQRLSDAIDASRDKQSLERLFAERTAIGSRLAAEVTAAESFLVADMIRPGWVSETVAVARSLASAKHGRRFADNVCRLEERAWALNHFLRCVSTPTATDDTKPHPLIAWAEGGRLKGKQLLVVKTILLRGPTRLADLGAVMEWSNVGDDFNRVRQEINGKLRADLQPYRLARRDSRGVIESAKIGQK